MVIYYSGTGNSSFAASQIAKGLNEQSLSLCDILKGKLQPDFSREKRLIFVAPVYAWQLPHLMRDWIGRTAFAQGTEAYFILTCGDEVGNAYSYACSLCKRSGLNFRGLKAVRMPENYIAMFSAPERQKALRIIDRASSVINECIACISEGKALPKDKITLIDKLKSGLINDIFYKFIISDKAFCADDKCISCGKCAEKCPLDNIKIIDGRPQWQGNCTHCMACISFCPVRAIEYGKKTRDKERYTFPE